LAGARPFDEEKNRGIKTRFSVAGVFCHFSRVFQKCKELIQFHKFKRAFRNGCPGKRGNDELSLRLINFHVYEKNANK